MASIPVLQISSGHTFKLATATSYVVFFATKKSKPKWMRLHLAIMLENLHINTTTSITVNPINALLIFFLDQ